MLAFLRQIMYRGPIPSHGEGDIIDSHSNEEITRDLTLTLSSLHAPLYFSRSQALRNLFWAVAWSDAVTSTHGQLAPCLKVLAEQALPSSAEGRFLLCALMSSIYPAWHKNMQ